MTAIRFFFEMIGKGINWIYNALGGEGNLWDKVFGKMDQWRHKIKIFFEDIANFGSKALIPMTTI